MSKKLSGVVVLLAFVLAAAALFVAVQPPQEVRGTPRYYGSFVANSSSNYVKLWNGADFTMYSDEGTTAVLAVDGATGNVTMAGDTTSSGNMDLNGNDLIIDTNGDSILDTSANDTVNMTLGSITGTFNILTGSLSVGDGTPDVGLSAEDAYVEGTLEADGSARLDGAIDANSTMDVAGTATFSKGSGNAVVVSAGGNLSLPATADLMAAGYVAVGDGTPNGAVTAGADESLYTEGNFEVDGTSEFDGVANFDGAVDLDSTLDVAGTSTLGGAVVVNDNATITGTLDVQGGDITLENDETIGNAVNGTIALGGAVDVTGASLQYGPNNLYPLGVDTSGFEVVWDTTTITNSGTVVHGLTSPTWASCTYGAVLVDNEEQKCAMVISGTTVTAYTYKEAGTAGDSGVPINWMVIGLP